MKNIILILIILQTTIANPLKPSNNQENRFIFKTSPIVSSESPPIKQITELTINSDNNDSDKLPPSVPTSDKHGYDVTNQEATIINRFKQRPKMEMGTLDEFLLSTTLRNNFIVKKGTLDDFLATTTRRSEDKKIKNDDFVFPNNLDEEISEISSKEPSKLLYAIGFSYSKYPNKNNTKDISKRIDNKVPNLSYKPMRPFYAQNYPYNPTKVEDNINDIQDRFGEITTKIPGLNFKPESTKLPHQHLTSIENRFESSTPVFTTKITSKVPDLGYKPTRPFYAPNYHYPQPINHPPFTNFNQNNCQEATHETTQKTTTFTPLNVPDLSYKPMRPFYAPNYQYPQPTKFPPNSGSNNFEFSSGQNNFEDKFSESTTIKTTTYRPFRPQSTSKVPNLSYKPQLPFYAQNWQGYPLPTTKNPQYQLKTIKDNKISTEEEHNKTDILKQEEDLINVMEQNLKLFEMSHSSEISGNQLLKTNPTNIKRDKKCTQSNHVLDENLSKKETSKDKLINKLKNLIEYIQNLEITDNAQVTSFDTRKSKMEKM